MSTQLVQRYYAEFEKIKPLELRQKVCTVSAETIKTVKEMEP